MKKRITVGTRPSKLAYTQTEQTVALLAKANPNIFFEIKKISTRGDRDRKSSLTAFSGTGVFVKELEEALLSGGVDIAVHSLKDMPSQQPKGLVLAGFPKREDPRDVLISRVENPKVIATASPRRALQCAMKYSDASFVEIRGNVDTRLRKLEEGYCDATYLAAAGLARLGITPNGANFLAVEDFIPAVGQGVLAVQCRAEDTNVQRIVSFISDEKTALEVKAERAFLKKVEGGCKFPLAGHAYILDDKMYFLAMIGNLESRRYQKERIVFSVKENIEEQVVTLASRMLREFGEL